MCGIVGFVDFGGHAREDARARVGRMADTIVHRGPDEGGYYVDDHAALGHRRLSIIDLSSGQQPMGVADGSVQIVFNGEIYNFPELRAELEGMGHRFRTQCDTEVILLAYIQWGDDCVSRLHGMFAFAIWDKRTRRLLLARDRVGKKPLFYLLRSNGIAFASELKALLVLGESQGTLDPEALDCYFSFGYIPAPRTILKDVRKLEAARYLTVTATGQKAVRYWQLSFAEVAPRSLDEATDEFEALFDDAVKRRLMSEVPLGAFLSGGIDSSIVVSSMARQTSRPVKTNSIGFDDREFNELPVARATASFLNAEHHEHLVTPQIDDLLGRIVWYLDEPLADSSAVPTWYVCQMARQSVTVALSGDGGDEGFGGYTFRYRPHMIEARLRQMLPSILRRTVFGTVGALWPASARLPRPLRLKTIFENLSVGNAEAFYRDLAWLRPDARSALYNGQFSSELRGFTPMEAVEPHYVDCDASDALGRAQYADINFYMTDDVLVKVDRMSMAHALEVRSPLLDHRILEFAARLPSQLKIGGQRGKLVLRQLAARRLPAEILKLPKRGFSVPAARWLRNELRGIVEDIVMNGDSIIAEFLDLKTVRRMWGEHLRGQRDHDVFFWGLMMLGLWNRRFRKEGML
ncbi:MAG: asparagine synthase (glutamine-hydrolyzing) [Rhodocyclaceae bacterium]|nr:asparagine synthase (glutamine-hydrolyzing) [Rhodocyclaceae bacterium]